MKRITRSTLARYAGLLGPRSIAANALLRFDAARAEGQRPIAYLRNNGFAVETRPAGGSSLFEYFG